jgi:hypothetical protein
MRGMYQTCGVQTEMREVEPIPEIHFLIFCTQIMTGKGGSVREPIYPQKATHMQALMISGKLQSTRVIPPIVVRDSFQPA